MTPWIKQTKFAKQLRRLHLKNPKNIENRIQASCATEVNNM